MPTYEYVCDGCGHQYERFQSITASPDRTCPKCGKRKVRRKIGIGAGVLFKGTGFYETDYRSDGYSKAAEAERKSSETPKPDAAKKDGGEAAKPADTGTKAEAPKPATPAEKAPKEPRMKALHPSREGRGQGNLRRTAAKRPRVRRKGGVLKKVVAGLAIASIALVVAAVLLVDVLARVGIEVAGSKVLGVTTTVRNADIGLVKDRSSITGLEVANPAGYTDPVFLSLGEASLTARLGELTGTDISIRQIALRDLTLTLEKDASGKLNATRISDNLPSTGEQQQTAQQPDAGKSRKVVVQELRIERVKVRLRNLVGGRQGVVDADLPDIVLTNVSSDGSVDVLASQVSGMVIGSVLQSTLTANIEGLSSEVTEGLKGALKDSVNSLPSDLRGPVESIRGTVGEALDKAGSQIQKGVGDALQGLFGGKDKPKSSGN